MRNPVCPLGSRCTVRNQSNVNTVVSKISSDKAEKAWTWAQMEMPNQSYCHWEVSLLLSLDRWYIKILTMVQNWLHVGLFLVVLVCIGTTSGSRICYVCSWMLNLTWFNQILGLVVIGSWKSPGWKGLQKIICSNFLWKRKPRWDYLAPCPVASWKLPVMGSLAYPCGSCSCDWLFSL